jgi:hypothetical protein
MRSVREKKLGREKCQIESQKSSENSANKRLFSPQPSAIQPIRILL